MPNDSETTKPSYKAARKLRNVSSINVDFEPKDYEPAGGFVSHIPKDYPISKDIIDNRNNVTATNAGKAAVVENPSTLQQAHNKAKQQ